MTFVNFNQINTKDFKPKRDIFQIILFVLILVGLGFIQKSCDKNYLKESFVTRGIIIEKSGGYKNTPTLTIEFKIKSKIIVSNLISQHECYKKYEIGDSINIKYSKENPKYVEILGCK